MFILYAVLAGLVAGLVTGGRLGGIGELRLRWPWLMFVGLAIQIVLFSDQVAAQVGDLGPVVYVGSTLLVLAALTQNLSVPGIPVVVLGAVSNLAAILANGGYMPASAQALASLGKSPPSIYSNSAVVEHPALEPLTDIFALPPWLPFANIFSLGDLLIGIGVSWAIAAAMHRRTGPAQA